jgi:hypothetical protein
VGNHGPQIYVEKGALSRKREVPPHGSREAGRLYFTNLEAKERKGGGSADLSRGGADFGAGRTEIRVAGPRPGEVPPVGTTARSPLYFFQQDAQRHSIVRLPLGNTRRVRRQPNDRLMRV